eukprot:3529440-Pleurochrysis_carterae.AAC.1
MSAWPALKFATCFEMLQNRVLRNRPSVMAVATEVHQDAGGCIKRWRSAERNYKVQNLPVRSDFAHYMNGART